MILICDVTEILRRLRDQGKTVEDLADAVGLSVDSLCRRLVCYQLTAAQTEKVMEYLSIQPEDANRIFFGLNH